MLYNRLIVCRNRFLREIDQLLIQVNRESGELIKTSPVHVNVRARNNSISFIKITAPIQDI
jgi:hypothetical protein